jgi:colanic acid/amylovoran biosynthesis glycosyltransferase
MRIAFFVHRFPVVSETFVLRQITGLIDLGHEVDIYSERSPEGGEPMHPEVAKYKLHERTTYLDTEMPSASGYWSMPIWPIWGNTWLPGAASPISNAGRLLHAAPAVLGCFMSAPRLTVDVLRPSAYAEQARSLEALYHLASLQRRAKSKRYDVIHAHFGPVGNNFRFVRRIWGAPLVVTFHGYDYCTVPREHGSGIYRELFRSVDAVTIHSDYGSRRLVAIGCPAEKLHRLHVGVEPAQFSFRPRLRAPAEEVRILTVARLVEIKGIRYAIEAFARLRAVRPRVRYEIVGDGPERPKLEELIRQAGLEGTVILHGAKDNVQVRDLMANAHLFVLPSIDLCGDQEGTPVSLMEAQASGLPVVASATGGIPEVIRDGKSGFLFPERDVAALADRLLFLIDHSEKWPELGACGRQHVEQNFDIRCLSHQLLMIYESVMSRNRSVSSVPLGA